MDVKLEQAFRHSYSKEFGRPITKETPDSYVINYSVIIEGKTPQYFDVEYRSRTNDYRIAPNRPICDKFIPNSIIKSSKKEVIETIKTIYEKILIELKS